MSSDPSERTGEPTGELDDSFHVFDTTLRDGAQREGINLTVADKLAIARRLDDFGVGFIEGLSASALADIARLAVLRLVVFARNRPQGAATVRTARPLPATRTATAARTAAPAGPGALCRAA
ncbi:hypothetical protein [Streptomyces sp. TLI_185]|uniref:hypothetical protein n=1 Tax=Streptomyces sp. TLI_185 TaxID=2485151 RepID=UPI0021A67B37|nr:hypothetical protein [Streptomyces sp. TLI_185]